MTGPEREELFQRVAGAFLGFAVGDALGAPVEFMTSGEIRDRYGVLREMVGGGWLRLKPGQVTDDTEMSLCIARAICASGGWQLRAIAERFGAWLKTKPIDIGDTCRRGIRNYLLKGQLETPFNEYDAGNGALMRMVPVALYTLGDDPQLALCALEQAHLTHHHPLSDAACVSYGRMLQQALLGYSKNRLRLVAGELAVAHPQFTFSPYHGLATGYVVDTMQTVLHHFFRGRDFEDCLVGTVNQGGDADTTGAIIGGLAGAYYGLAAIPKRWRMRLDKALLEEVTGLAMTLANRSPLLSRCSS